MFVDWKSKIYKLITYRIIGDLLGRVKLHGTRIANVSALQETHNLMKNLSLKLIAAVLFCAAALSAGATTVFVGSWNVFNPAAPTWYNSPPNGPLAYTGQEAAALLFGGNASDYVISTVSSNIADINDLAWYDVIGKGGHTFSDDYSNKYLGLYYGPTSNYNGPNSTFFTNAASAFVRDNLYYDSAINYAFRVDAAVPDAASTFGLLGLGLLALAVVRRNRRS